MRQKSGIGSRPMRGFTLIETLVAITVLVIAIVAPMSLVAQSLSSAYYARDQVTASNLAQEGIEAVRAVRDGNILSNALSTTQTGLLAGIPIGQNFRIDATQTGASGITNCNGQCPPLQVDPLGSLYGYGSGWVNSKFVRTLFATYEGPSAINSGQDEIRVTVTVTWTTATSQLRTVKIEENMYRWVEDGSAL